MPAVQRKPVRISNREAAVMGLLSEGARYGYELEKIIEERHMRSWADIGFSSIYYALRKLESQRLIMSKRHIVTAGKPARRIYTITPLGREQLKKKIIVLLSEFHRIPSPFDLGISFSSVLSKTERIACMTAYDSRLSERMFWARERLQWSIKAKRPRGVSAKFERHAALVKAEKQWVRRFIKSES